MNLSNLIFWGATIITGLAGAYNIDGIQKAIWKVQSKLIYESRTETWGSPRFFRREEIEHGIRKKKIKLGTDFLN